MRTNVSSTMSGGGLGEWFFTAFLGSLKPGFHVLLLHLIPIWFLSLSRPNPLSLHPLLHLISFSPSIQIFFIGMTGPVVGDSHRHGGTMRCDGDIHMIMPSDLTLHMQTHWDTQCPFFYLSPFCISLCLDVLTFQMIFKSLVLSSCYAPACHSTTLISLLFSVPACLSLYLIFLPPFPLNTMLAITLNNFLSHGFWQCFFFNAAQFLTALYVSLCLSFFPCVCLLSHFCSSPCWQGPIYQLISAFPGTLPTGNTAGEKERERERMKEN